LDLLRLVIAILLPPLGVFLQVGIGKHFWINILLTLLGYIPGIIHAVWVIVKYWPSIGQTGDLVELRLFGFKLGYLGNKMVLELYLE
jgi:uncharacterized membrane protein YqaE (UPF0057 family)